MAVSTLQNDGGNAAGGGCEGDGAPAEGVASQRTCPKVSARDGNRRKCADGNASARLTRPASVDLSMKPRYSTKSGRERAIDGADPTTISFVVTPRRFSSAASLRASCSRLRSSESTPQNRRRHSSVGLAATSEAPVRLTEPDQVSSPGNDADLLRRWTIALARGVGSPKGSVHHQLTTLYRRALHLE